MSSATKSTPTFDWTRGLRCLVLAIFAGIYLQTLLFGPTRYLQVEMQCSREGLGQVFWDLGAGMRELDSSFFRVHPAAEFITYEIPIKAAELKAIRIDPIETPGPFKVRSIRLVSGTERIRIDPTGMILSPHCVPGSGPGEYLAKTDDAYLTHGFTPALPAPPEPELALSFILVVVLFFGPLLFWIEPLLVGWLARTHQVVLTLVAVHFLVTLFVTGGTDRLPSDGIWFRNYFAISIHQLPGIRALLTPTMLWAAGDNLDRFVLLQVLAMSTVPLLIFFALDRIGSRLTAFYGGLIAATFVHWHAFANIVLSEGMTVVLVTLLIFLTFRHLHRPTRTTTITLCLCFFLLPLAHFRLVICILPFALTVWMARTAPQHAGTNLLRTFAPVAAALTIGVLTNFFVTNHFTGKFTGFTTYGLANHALGMVNQDGTILDEAVRVGDPAALALRQAVTEAPTVGVTTQVWISIEAMHEKQLVNRNDAVNALNRAGRELARAHPRLYFNNVRAAAAQYFFEQPWMLYYYLESTWTATRGPSLPLRKFDSVQKKCILSGAALGVILLLFAWFRGQLTPLRGQAATFVLLLAVLDCAVSCLLEFSNHEHARYWVTASPAYLCIMMLALDRTINQHKANDSAPGQTSQPSAAFHPATPS